jgi:DNA-directed RNA polymerase sigma subunit (sigma70/sigma32)
MKQCKQAIKNKEQEKYYMTLQEIADELGISRDSARRLVDQALEKVKLLHPQLRELL